MARPKNKRTKKNTATVATVTEKAVIAEEAKAETAPAVTESAPVAEAPAVAEVKETKAAPKKKTAPAKTEAAKKDDVFVIQSSGKDYTMEDVKEACKEAYKNGTRKHIKSCDVYLKAENGGLRAYYVINGKADGAFIDL